jgi:hypothetical protein
MAERMIKCLPREATSPVVSQLQPSFRTTVVREQARSDFGETVGAVLDSISAFPDTRPGAGRHSGRAHHRGVSGPRRLGFLLLSI